MSILQPIKPMKTLILAPSLVHSVVMKALERKAIQQGARQVTLNTLCSRAAASLAGSDSPLPPDTRLNESWYERLGYEAYKREPRYKDQDKFGRPIKLTAVVSRQSCRKHLTRILSLPPSTDSVDVHQ